MARVLGAAPADLDVDLPLRDLGLDSLLAVELRRSLAREFRVEIPLASLLDASGLPAVVEALESGRGGHGAGSADRAAWSGDDVVAPQLTADGDARYEPFPLTDLQQAYLIGRQPGIELGGISTCFFAEVDLVGVDLDRLVSSFRRLVDRHDMLRAVFTADGYQRVRPDPPDYQIRRVDLRDCPREQLQEQLDVIHREVCDQSFDIENGPLFDVQVTLIDARTVRLHAGFDAMIVDGWSASLLFREWADLYRRPDVERPPLEIRYRDYVLAVAARSESVEVERAWDYWRPRIASLPPAPDLPLRRNPATITRPVFVHRSARLGGAEWGRFVSHARAHGVTPSVALCTAYAQILAAWSTSNRFTLNLLAFNRSPLHSQVKELIGNFSNTTLLAVDSDPAASFAARARALQAQLLTDLEHGEVGGVQVLRERNRLRGSGVRPAMPVVFTSTVGLTGSDPEHRAAGIMSYLTELGEQGRPVASSVRTPQVWLDHQAVMEGDELTVNWDVVDDLFPAGMPDAMFDAYVAVLHRLAAGERAWEQPAGNPLSARDVQVRDEANATSAPLPAGLLHDGFLARAVQTPDAVAVIAADRSLSYGEVDALFNQIDRRLRDLGARPGTLVAIVLDKGWQQVVSAVGVLKSGAAYVPIDAQVPTRRLHQLLDGAGISLVLTRHVVEESTRWPEGTRRIIVDGGSLASLATTPLPAAGAVPHDLAYVIFTSGSTGEPKGVMIEHAGALNTVVDVNDRFAVTAADRVLALSALNFDLSVWDIFGTLAAGGALVLPAPDALREPARWAELVAEHRVTVWNSVPALMEMFTEHAIAARAHLESLRLVMMSGDWIPVSLPDRIRRIAPDADLWSLGGATEASIWSNVYPIGAVDLG